MLKKTITYKDYNDVQQTEDFYFNLDKLELMELEIQFEGSLTETIERIVEANDGPAIYNLFKDLLLKSYGIKSSDGKRFMKSDDIALSFAQSPAMAELIFEFLRDADGAAKFISGLMPSQEVVDQVRRDFEAGMAAQAAKEQAATQQGDGQVVPGTVITSPEPVTPTTPEAPVAPPAAEKKFEDYSEAELLEMPLEQFQALVPAKPQDMTRDQLMVAMKRKNAVDNG